MENIWNLSNVSTFAMRSPPDMHWPTMAMMPIIKWLSMDKLASLFEHDFFLLELIYFASHQFVAVVVVVFVVDVFSGVAFFKPCWQRVVSNFTILLNAHRSNLECNNDYSELSINLVVHLWPMISSWFSTWLDYYSSCARITFSIFLQKLLYWETRYSIEKKPFL